MRACPECGAEIESPVGCASCGALGVWDEARTPYELFGLEPAWDVSGIPLRKKLLQFSRLCHPDFFATRGEELRERAEKNSAELNQAFEILTNDFRRANWLLQHLGGPSEQKERQMPQAFLMEVLEWSETLEEVREQDGVADDSKLDALASELAKQREESIQQFAPLLEPLPEQGAPALLELRKLLNAIRYVDRTLAEIRALRLQRASSH